VNTSSIPLSLPKQHLDRAGLEARFGMRLGSILTERAQACPHDISERLRFGREMALARAQSRRVVQSAVAGGTEVAGRSGLSAVLGQRPPWMFRLASALPLLLLVAGMMLIDEWHDRAQIVAAADVDTALLADDLPPGAYSDPGFVEYLKSAQN